MRGGLAPAVLGSILLHAGLLAFALVRWPEESRELIAQAVPVTIVSSLPPAAPVIAPPEPVPAETPPEPEAAELLPPEPPAPAPTPQPTPPPKKSLTPAKPTPAKKSEPTLDLDALSDSLAKTTKPKAKPRPPAPAAKTGGATTTGPLSAASGVALNSLVGQLQRMWNPNCGVEGADQIVVSVQFTVSESGRVSDGPRLVKRTSADPVWRAAAARATAAVRAAEPYDELPKELYNQPITVNFRGDLACR